MRKALLFFGSLAAVAVLAVLPAPTQAQTMHSVMTPPTLAEVHPFIALAPKEHIRSTPTHCEMTRMKWWDRFKEAIKEIDEDEEDKSKYVILRRVEFSVAWRDGITCNFASFDYIEKEHFNIEHLAEAQDLKRDYQVLLSPLPMYVAEEREGWNKFTPPPSVDQSSAPVGEVLIGRYPPLFDFSNLRASANN